MKPDLVEAYYNRSNIYRDKDDFDAAIEDFNRAINLDPKYAGVQGIYIKMAQNALPILVSHAQKREIITLQQLAQEIAPDLPQFNRIINWNMGWTLAWIHTMLYDLERLDEWNYGEIPAIAAIAVDNPEKPTNWMDKKTRINLNTPLPWKAYETNHILSVFEYLHCDKVMDFVS